MFSSRQRGSPDVHLYSYFISIHFQYSDVEAFKRSVYIMGYSERMREREREQQQQQRAEEARKGIKRTGA